MKTRFFILLVTCLWVGALSSADNSQVHEKLNDEEFQRVFHRVRRDVPNYEFVKFESKASHRSKRELRPVEFTVDGKKIQLNLRPAEHDVFSRETPIWFVETKNGQGYNFQKADTDESEIDGVFYEDPKTMATMLAYYKEGYIYYDGIFGESKDAKVVRAEPENWWMKPEDVENENHFIYGVNQTGSTVILSKDDDKSISEKLDEPLNTFYPKLLLIVDYTEFEKLGKNVEETIKYVATFWNAVNLKYSKIESPKIKILITGLIIAKDPTALEYVHKAKNATDMMKLDYLKMMNYARAYFRDEFANATGFWNYDSSLTMISGLDTGVTAGAAWPGAICGEHYNLGFVKDDGSFSGLLAATHELGHLLNLAHDDEKTNGCNGYIDENTSTVMAAYVSSVKEFIWSECSKKALAKFSWNKKSECLKDIYNYQRRPE